MSQTSNGADRSGWPSGWYIILAAKELPSRGQFVALERFGIALVLTSHSDGTYSLLEDRCPHRAAKLSLGTFKDGRLECPFHGFRFDSEGVCVWIPEIERGAPGMRLRRWEIKTAHGFLWMWWGGGVSGDAIPTTQADQIPWFLDMDESYGVSLSKKSWPMHLSRCIENQLDFAHVPFVHRSTIGRGANPKNQPHLDSKTERHIQFFFSGLGGSQGYPYIEYRYANIWQNYLFPKLIIFLAFVPVRYDETLFYLGTYQKIVSIRGLKNTFAWLFNFFNSYILQEDRRVVLSQRPLDTSTAHDEKLVASDQPIRIFRNWWALTASAASGSEAPKSPKPEVTS